MSLIEALKMTRTALKNEKDELHRCNTRYREIQKEIREIDSLIMGMERSEARRRSTYEKRIRAIRRNRDREVRRRIYLGLRLDPVGTNRNVSPFCHGFRSMTAKRKGG